MKRTSGRLWRFSNKSSTDQIPPQGQIQIRFGRDLALEHRHRLGKQKICIGILNVSQSSTSLGDNGVWKKPILNYLGVQVQLPPYQLSSCIIPASVNTAKLKRKLFKHGSP